MKLGFTGTQAGMTKAQQLAVYDEIHYVCDDTSKDDEYHHGMCVGSDKEFHGLVRIWTNAPIVGHPPLNKSKMAECDCDILWPAKEYLERNRDIVEVSDHLIAAPQFMFEEQRSGTWMTVRHARRMGVPRSIVWPDGTVTREPIIAKRREAAGKIGDENAPQTQGPEVYARRLPDVQTS